VSDSSGSNSWRAAPPRELVDRIYESLRRLERGVGGKRLVRDTSAAMGWPTRGLYIFYEPNETRSSTPSISRVVRVGTHAVGIGRDSSLWKRLRTHKGSEGGEGHHRSSVMRKHIGRAILRKRGDESDVPTWGRSHPTNPRQLAAESDLEREVSEYIGRMEVLWLAIDDPPGPASHRAIIEEFLVAAVSNHECPIDQPSPTWLGRWSDHRAIRSSGLWNVLLTLKQAHKSRFALLERYVDSTIADPTGASRVSRSPPTDKSMRLKPYVWDRFDQGR
jgi:hypothetical protein